MDTVNLTNALKSLFGTSQTSATNIPTCASDGTPAGNISVANLASVLGVGYLPSYNHSNTPYDCNTAVHGYHRGSVFTNTPPDSGQMGAILIDIGASNDATLLHTQYFVWYGSTGIYSRCGYEDNWDVWSRIDNFGCSTLSDLASALGVISNSARGKVIDADTVLGTTPFGIVALNNETSTNIPVGKPGILLQFGVQDSYMGNAAVQIYIPNRWDMVSLKRIYLRTRWTNGVWDSTWYSVVAE